MRYFDEEWNKIDLCRLDGILITLFGIFGLASTFFVANECIYEFYYAGPVTISDYCLLYKILATFLVILTAIMFLLACYLVVEGIYIYRYVAVNLYRKHLKQLRRNGVYKNH